MPWRRLASPPGPRYGAAQGTITMNNIDYVLVFGGLVTDEGQTNSLLRLSRSSSKNPAEATDSWEEWQASSSSPTPPARMSTGCCVYKQSLFVYGGLGASARYSDTWQFDLVSDLWREVKCSGASPPARNGHTCSLINDHFMLIIGGFSNRRLDDAWVLDLLPFSSSKSPAPVQWRNCSGRGLARCARSEHSAVVISANQREKLRTTIDQKDRDQDVVLVFAGNAADSLDDLSSDLSLFDTTDWQWYGVDTFGDPPAPRRSHCAMLMLDSAPPRMLVCGGFGVNSRLDDVHVLQLDTMTWSHLHKLSIGARGAHIAGLQATERRGEERLWCCFGFHQGALGAPLLVKSVDSASTPWRSPRASVCHPYGADASLSSADPAARQKRKGLCCWRCGAAFRPWKKKIACASCHHQFCQTCAELENRTSSTSEPVCCEWCRTRSLRVGTAAPGGEAGGEAARQTAGSRAAARSSSSGSKFREVDADLEDEDANPLRWSVDDVKAWLVELGWQSLASRFQAEAVDGGALLILSAAQLHDLGLKNKRQLKKFERHLDSLRSSAAKFRGSTAQSATARHVSRDTGSSRELVNFRDFTVDDCINWLCDAGLGDYAEVFREGAVDGSVITDLDSEEELKESVGITLSTHRRSFLCALSVLRDRQRTFIHGGSWDEPLECWPLETVLSWLHSIGLAAMREQFQRHAVNGAYLARLSEAELVKSVGVKNRLQRLKLLKLISRLPRIAHTSLLGSNLRLNEPMMTADGSSQYDWIPVSDDEHNRSSRVTRAGARARSKKQQQPPSNNFIGEYAEVEVERNSDAEMGTFDNMLIREPPSTFETIVQVDRVVEADDLDFDDNRSAVTAVTEVSAVTNFSKVSMSKNRRNRRSIKLDQRALHQVAEEQAEGGEGEVAVAEFLDDNDDLLSVVSVGTQSRGKKKKRKNKKK